MFSNLKIRTVFPTVLAHLVFLVAPLGLPTAQGKAIYQEPGSTDSPSGKSNSESDAAASKPKPTTKPEKKKRPAIYDESADLGQTIELALAEAKANNKRVLIQWGANWCVWCHQLHDLFQSNDSIRKTIREEYIVILADVGRMDKHSDLMEKYKVDLKSAGVPFITVLDSAGKVVINQETTPLEKKGKDESGHDEKVVLKFLQDHVASQVDAEVRVEEAFQQARTEKKLVFLHFGAPWCGWCHHLERWLAEPEVSRRLAPAFVDLKVDTEKMKNGDAIYQKYCKQQEGIPWFVFLNPESNQEVINSSGPDGNVGFPSTDAEIGHFCDMLTASQKLSKEDIEWLRESLVKDRLAREKK